MALTQGALKKQLDKCLDNAPGGDFLLEHKSGAKIISEQQAQQHSNQQIQIMEQKLGNLLNLEGVNIRIQYEPYRFRAEDLIGYKINVRFSSLRSAKALLNSPDIGVDLDFKVRSDFHKADPRKGYPSMGVGAKAEEVFKGKKRVVIEGDKERTVSHRTLKKKIVIGVASDYNVKEEYRIEEYADKDDMLWLRVGIWHEYMEIALLAIWQTIFGDCEGALASGESQNKADVAVASLQTNLINDDRNFLYWSGDPAFSVWEGRGMYYSERARGAEKAAQGKQDAGAWADAVNRWQEAADLWDEAIKAWQDVKDSSPRKNEMLKEARESRKRCKENANNARQQAYRQGSRSSLVTVWRVRFAPSGEVIIAYSHWPGKCAIQIWTNSGGQPGRLVKSISEPGSAGVITLGVSSKLDPGRYILKPWLEAYTADEDREKAARVAPELLGFTLNQPTWKVKIDEVAHNPQVVIDFRSFFKGFEAKIYYKQRLVDTLTSATPSGQFTWGEGKKHAEYEIKVNVNGVWQSKRIERFSARAPWWKFDYDGNEIAPGISIEYKYWEPGKLGCPVTIEGPRGTTHSFNDHISEGKYWYTLKNKPHGLYLIKVDTDYPRNKVRHIRPIHHSPNSPDHQ